MSRAPLDRTRRTFEGLVIFGGVLLSAYERAIIWQNRRESEKERERI